MFYMKIQRYVVGPVSTNCYFVINDNEENEVQNGFIVDPGYAPKRLIEEAEKLNFVPEAILLTHGHFDHIEAAAEIAAHFNIPVCCHEAEADTLTDPNLNLSYGLMGKSETYHADRFFRDEQEIEVGGFKIRVLFTPGHTPGGCCYYLPYEQLVFSGDSLFCGSIGRTDFPGGSMRTLVDCVKAKLMKLPERTTVLPGHNEMTTIEDERINNPYLV